jgi:crotonobetaine/carnitine-CoA ligase
MVVHADLVRHLDNIALSKLETLIVVGNNVEREKVQGLRCLSSTLLSAPAEIVAPAQAIRPWDTQSIIYTSGTTGPSKAVLSCYAHLWSSCYAEAFVFIRDDDRILCGLPLFHAGGTMNIIAALIRGGSVAILQRFRTDQFWDVVRRSESTVGNLVGAMIAFLANAPPQPNEKNHPLRAFIGVPSNEDMKVFASRYGVEGYTAYNMTETSMPLRSGANPASGGFCGTLRPGVQARIVDDNDCEVATGEVGELILRTDAPWAMNSGYYKDEAATARAWRNGWFHTGDYLRTNAKGEFFFSDRKKDAIRRRGENISSFEVESAAKLHPHVKDAVAYAVPNAQGDDDVMLAVTLVNADELDHRDLINLMAGQLAHFMVPRYFRTVSDFPRTPTDKIEKHKLRSEGVTPDTWDREAHGVAVKRQDIG